MLLILTHVQTVSSPGLSALVRFSTLKLPLTWRRLSDTVGSTQSMAWMELSARSHATLNCR